MLLLPTVLMFTEYEESFRRIENRKLSEVNFSTLKEAKKSIINLNNFYKDNFGMKYFFYNFYKKNVSDRYEESPSNDKVLYGKSNWLFLGNYYHNAFSEAKGELVFKNEEINLIRENLKTIKEWCESQEIVFYINVVPGKHTVYKEFLPYRFEKQKTKLDQLIEIFPGLIDLRLALEKQKQKPLYFKTDTHWNYLGAFEGYLKVLESIIKDNQSIKSLNKSDIDSVSYSYERLGDINKILGLKSTEIEPRIHLRSRLGKEDSKRIEVPTYHRLEKSTYEKRYVNDDALNDLKIVLLRDSFSDFYLDYFRATFKEVVFIYNHRFDQTIIAKENPDILLYVIGERVIDRFVTILD